MKKTEYSEVAEIDGARFSGDIVGGQMEFRIVWKERKLNGKKWRTWMTMYQLRHAEGLIYQFLQKNTLFNITRVKESG